MMCACQDAKIENKYSLSGMSFHDKKVPFFSTGCKKTNKTPDIEFFSGEKDFRVKCSRSKEFSCISAHFQLFTNHNSELHTTYEEVALVLREQESLFLDFFFATYCWLQQFC